MDTRASFHLSVLRSSRKYPYPPQGRSLEIPRRRGISNAKISKGKYELKLNWKFQGGSNKKPSVGREDFLGSTHLRAIFGNAEMSIFGCLGCTLYILYSLSLEVMGTITHLIIHSLSTSQSCKMLLSYLHVHDFVGYSQSSQSSSRIPSLESYTCTELQTVDLA